MSDARPALAAIFDAFGVPATITPPGLAPVTTSVIWQGTAAAEYPGADNPRAEMVVMELRRRLQARKDQVPTLPIGSVISAPVFAGGTPQNFVVAAIEGEDDELFNAVVV